VSHEQLYLLEKSVEDTSQQQSESPNSINLVKKIPFFKKIEEWDLGKRNWFVFYVG